MNWFKSTKKEVNDGQLIDNIDELEEAINDYKKNEYNIRIIHNIDNIRIINSQGSEDRLDYLFPNLPKSELKIILYNLKIDILSRSSGYFEESKQKLNKCLKSYDK